MTSPQKDTADIVVIIIRNSARNFFTHQRSNDKAVFPGLYGTGAGGHVRQGETHQAASRRELAEETGLTSSPTFLFSFPFTSIEGPHQTHVYEIVTDEPVQPDTHEWQWSGWLAAAGVVRLISEGKLMPDTKILFEKYMQAQKA